MLILELGTIEEYDEEINQFRYYEGGTVRFEYSLKTMYDWESKWKKPFLEGKYNDEELKDFFCMMAMDPFDERFLTREVLDALGQYVGSTQTATTFSAAPSSSQNANKFNIGKIYTAEEIYGLMFMNNVDLEFENRNLNRLLVILRVINNYNTPKEKMSQADIYEQNRKLNEQRKAEMKTKG